MSWIRVLLVSASWRVYLQGVLPPNRATICTKRPWFHRAAIVMRESSRKAREMVAVETFAARATSSIRIGDSRELKIISFYTLDCARGLPIRSR